MEVIADMVVEHFQEKMQVRWTEVQAICLDILPKCSGKWICKKCEIQISYAIGMKQPLSVYVDTFGTATIPEEKIVELIREKFDLTPNGIINYLDLKQPIYRQTTNYGHFGKENLPWEKVIKM